MPSISPVAAEIAARHGVTKATGKFNGSPVYRIPEVCHAAPNRKKDLAIWDGDGESVGARCHSQGCSYQAILDALGIEFTYSGRKYRRADGSEVKRRRGTGKDHSGNPGSSEGLLVKLGVNDAPDKAVVLVEGEKAFDALEAWQFADYTAACWSGGTGSVEHVDFSPLKDRHVILWPDVDQAGAQAIDKAATKLRGLAASLRICNVSSLGPGNDAADVKESEALGLLEAAVPHVDALSPLMRVVKTEQGIGELSLCREYISQHADHLLIAWREGKQEKTQGETYFLLPSGLWSLNDEKMQSGLSRIINELRAQAWELPDKANEETPSRSGARRDLKQLSERTPGILRHIPVFQHRAESEPAIAAICQPITTTVWEALDKDGRYLGCANGVVDLATGERLEPAKARRYLVTRSTGVEFDAEAKHDILDRLTSHLAPDAEEYLWSVLGRSLWGDPEKSFLVLVGPKDGGKTSISRALLGALGSECDSISQDLMRPTYKGGRQGVTPEREPLVNARLVIGAEVESWPIDAQKLKVFAGAGDSIAVNPKFMPQYSKPLRAAILLYCNQMPKLDADIQGLDIRLRVIPYPRPTTRDEKVIQACKGDRGLHEAVLAKLIKYAKANPPGKEIPVPPSVQEAVAQHINELRGPFGQFMAERMKEGADADRISYTDIWEAFKEWIGEDGVTIEDGGKKDEQAGGVRRSEIGRRIKTKFGLSSRRTTDAERRHVYLYTGLRLLADSETSKEKATLSGANAATAHEIPAIPPEQHPLLEEPQQDMPDSSAVLVSLGTHRILVGLQQGTQAARIFIELTERLERCISAGFPITPRALGLSSRYIDSDTVFSPDEVKVSSVPPSPLASLLQGKGHSLSPDPRQQALDLSKETSHAVGEAINEACAASELSLGDLGLKEATTVRFAGKEVTIPTAQDVSRGVRLTLIPALIAGQRFTSREELKEAVSYSERPEGIPTGEDFARWQFLRSHVARIGREWSAATGHPSKDANPDDWPRHIQGQELTSRTHARRVHREQTKADRYAKEKQEKTP